MVTSATFRHPGPLAISVAQVDEMSGGRVDLGIGAGWFERSTPAYAIPFPPLGERFERLAEQLDILTGLWTTPVGQTFDYAGTHYTVTDSPALPKPVQRSAPADRHRRRSAPSGPRRSRRSFAAEFNVPFPSLDVVKTQFDRVSAALHGGRSARRLDDLLGVLRGVRRAATTPKSPGGPPRSAARSTNCATTPRWSAPRPKSSTSWRPSREAGVQRVYLQCWIWPTSTTWNCSPARSRRQSQ